MAELSEQRADRRKRKRQRSKRSDWRKNPTAKTPYEQWGEVAAEYRKDVQIALARVGGGNDFNYKKSSDRKPSRLTIEELSVGLFAVDCVGKRGIAYGQLQRAFKVAKVGWSRAKAPSIFRALVGLGLIQQVGNYSADSHGNCYRVVRDQSDKIAPWD